MKFEKRTIYYIVILFAIIVVFYQLTNYLDNRQDLNIPITPVKLEIKDLDQGQTEAKHSEIASQEEDADSAEDKGNKGDKDKLEEKEKPQANNKKAYQDESQQSAGEALEVGAPAGSKPESQSQSKHKSHKQPPAQPASQQKSSKEPSPASPKTAPQPSKHKGTLIKPIAGKISTAYGLAYSEIYEDYRLHPAVDIKAKSGTSVKAALQGRVLKVTRSKREKIRITIDHGEGLITSYAHIGTAKVKKGSTVQQGQLIGILGKPGSAETKQGSHIHFEVEDNKKLVNPKDYLK